MKTKKRQTQIYLVFVPHRETRQILRKYSEELIKTGLKSVIPFPLVAPLAELERPFTAEELKKHAHDLRNNMGKEKFTINETDYIPFQIGKKDYLLTGFRLGVGSGEWGVDTSNNKSIPYSLLPTPLIGLYLFNKNNQKEVPQSLAPIPDITFRAAAVANMFWKPVNGGFKYKIGNLCWLPRVK